MPCVEPRVRELVRLVALYESDYDSQYRMMNNNTPDSIRTALSSRCML